MATPPPTLTKPAELRRRVLETIAANPWSEEQQAAIRAFANGLTNRTGPEEIVGDYLKLVRRLGERHGLGESMAITEGGRLLVFLDAKVYQGVPVGEIIDPVGWIRRKLNTRSWSKIHRKLEGWISALPRAPACPGRRTRAKQGLTRLRFRYRFLCARDGLRT
jgi:hypothetical protein